MTENSKSDATLTYDLCVDIMNNSKLIGDLLTRDNCCEVSAKWVSKLSTASAYLELLKEHLSEEIAEQAEEALEDADKNEEADDDMLPPSARMMKKLNKQ